MLESSIQSAVVKYARSKGLLSKKLSTMGPMGNTGWPDYMFLGGKSPIYLPEDEDQKIIFFIEFKKPGGKLTPLQANIKVTLEGMGFRYYVVDDPKQGRNLVDAELSR